MPCPSAKGHVVRRVALRINRARRTMLAMIEGGYRSYDWLQKSELLRLESEWVSVKEWDRAVGGYGVFIRKKVRKKPE